MTVYIYTIWKSVVKDYQRWDRCPGNKVDSILYKLISDDFDRC